MDVCKPGFMCLESNINLVVKSWNRILAAHFRLKISHLNIKVKVFLVIVLILIFFLIRLVGCLVEKGGARAISSDSVNFLNSELCPMYLKLEHCFKQPLQELNGLVHWLLRKIAPERANSLTFHFLLSPYDWVTRWY